VDTQRVGKISQRADAYGIAGVTVDGNDPDATYLVARDAVQRARTGGGPTLIEAMTYRFMGHLFGDQMPYIPKEELQARMSADPVPRYRERLIADAVATDSELDALDQRLGDELVRAVDAALAAPLPAADELFTDVYAKGVLV
jgi:pyruvate dehydrogenase E1 component alpha subunit